ncbi:MAG: hypothetical protein JST21_10415 [Bacteroidetes bacterium]|nr:hypothetical protein [Bacteroidota bacterium]
MNFLSNGSYSLGLLIATAIIAFGLGMMIKYSIISKQRKKILRLEDEMLNNHSRILGLEKKIAETRKDTNGISHDFDLSSSHSKDLEIKAS